MTQYQVMMAKQGTGTREFVNIGKYNASTPQAAIRLATRNPDARRTANYIAVPTSYVTSYNPVQD